MTVGLHSIAFRDGWRTENLARRGIARLTTLSTSMVGSLLAAPTAPLPRLTDTDARWIARSMDRGRPVAVPGGDQLSAVTLPLTLLHCARSALPGLHALLDIVRDTRERAVILGRMTGRYGARMSVVSARDDDLFFDWIGYGIRWSGRDLVGARALDLPDGAVARTAAERYWTALRSGEPVFQYVRTQVGLEFMALTVATDPATRLGLVTITSLGAAAAGIDRTANENQPRLSNRR